MYRKREHSSWSSQVNNSLALNNDILNPSACRNSYPIIKHHNQTICNAHQHDGHVYNRENKRSKAMRPRSEDTWETKSENRYRRAKSCYRDYERNPEHFHEHYLYGQGLQRDDPEVQKAVQIGLPMYYAPNAWKQEVQNYEAGIRYRFETLPSETDDKRTLYMIKSVPDPENPDNPIEEWLPLASHETVTP